MKLFYKKFTVLAFLVLLAGLMSTGLKAQVLYNESFNTVAPLPAGWAQQNLSSPIGAQAGWFQGNNTVFPSNSGATTAYIAANFQNVAGANTISNWLFMPNVTLKNGDIFTFYTRTVTAPAFPDRLQVRMSTNGASVNAGASATSVGDFTTLLLDINPTYSTSGYPNVWTQYTITISGLGGPTSGRLAFRYFVEDGGPAGNNSDYMGIDDAVYTTFAAACSGTPVPGNTASSVPTVCPTTNFTLSLPNLPAASGYSFQWQSSPDGTTWTNIAGATLSTLTTSQLTATYYQCIVTCSGNSANSTPLQVPLSPATSCYCLAGATDQIFEKISNVTYNTINNSSTSTAGYENFTNISTSVVQQSTLPITVTIANAFNTDQVIVWIDFNQDGDFTDPGEQVYTSTAGVGPHTGNITIPATSLLGPTRMRVRMHDSGFGGNTTPCGNSAYGQVEDYTVNITPCIPLAITTQPANTSIACGGNATFSIAATGSGPSYQWQERTSASANWTNLANSAMYGGVTTNTLTITGAPVTMNGYQYRVVFSGYCRATDVTSAATLTVTPLVATVNPSSANICNGGSQQLTITNITSPLPASAVVNSGAISLPIPDNNVTGINHTLAVAGVPAAAVITGLSVKFNITHTYDGDLIIVLKAPNGQILNLDYFLTATGNPGTNFVNTVISSAGTTALSAGTAPFTGTFKADAQTTATFGPTGPTGFSATTNSWGALYTTGGSVNGNWTIAIYDGGAIDVGTLTNWELTVNYLAGIPATGVWTGPAGSMFNDAALTIPYTGTAANTIYVNPTATANYTVVVTTPVCVSGPTTVPVTVSNPIGTVTDPVNATICAGNSTSFTVGTASGNPINYQWQVSTDGGTNWTNIANNSVYGGATTATLTLNGVPVSYNGYKYRVTMSVTACASNATSGSATLTVNPNPTITLAAAPYTALYPGISTVITPTVTPNAGATYQWFKNGAAIPGATGSSLPVDVDGLGVYTVSVVDVNGCPGTSSSIEITAAPNDIMFIYPSPNTGQFQVRYYSAPGSVVPRYVTIYDSKGARVYSQRFSVAVPYGRIDVDMKNHGKGIYRVELGDLNGKRIKAGNVIVL